MQSKSAGNVSVKLNEACLEEKRLADIYDNLRSRLNTGVDDISRSLEILKTKSPARPVITLTSVDQLRCRVGEKRSQVQEDGLSHHDELLSQKESLQTEVSQVEKEIAELKLLQESRFAGVDIDGARKRHEDALFQRSRLAADLEEFSAGGGEGVVALKRREVEETAMRLQEAEASLAIAKKKLQDQVVLQRISRESFTASAVLQNAFGDFQRCDGDFTSLAAKYALKYGLALVSRGMSSCLIDREEALEFLHRSFEVNIDSQQLIVARIHLAKALGYKYMTAFADDDQASINPRSVLCGKGCIFEKDTNSVTSGSGGGGFRSRAPTSIGHLVQSGESGSGDPFEGLRMVYAGDLHYGGREGLGVMYHTDGKSPKFFGRFRRDVPSGYGVSLSRGGNVTGRGVYAHGQLQKADALASKKLGEQDMSEYSKGFLVLNSPGESFGEVVLLCATETVKVFRTPVGVFFHLVHERVNESLLRKCLTFTNRLNYPGILTYKGYSRDPAGLLTARTVDEICSPISGLLASGKLVDAKVIHRVFLLTAKALLAFHMCTSMPHGCLDWNIVWTSDRLNPEDITSFRIKLAYLSVPTKSAKWVPRGEKSPSISVDVFAFGHMMCEVLSQPVGEGQGDVEDTLQSIVPEWLDSIMGDAIVPRAEDRPTLSEIVGRLTAGEGLSMQIGFEETEEEPEGGE